MFDTLGSLITTDPTPAFEAVWSNTDKAEAQAIWKEVISLVAKDAYAAGLASGEVNAPLVAALWRQVWRTFPFGLGQRHICRECGGASVTRTTVIHSPGCVLHGLDAATVERLEARESTQEPTP